MRATRRAVVRPPFAILAVVLVAACAGPTPSPRPVPVTLYGRNAAPLMAWFATQPVTSPLSSVGFGRELGYACWTVPEGSSLVLLDHAPSDVQPASAVRVLDTIEADPAGGRVVWVDVDKAGAVTSGVGLPGWWPAGGGAC